MGSTPLELDSSRGQVPNLSIWFQDTGGSLVPEGGGVIVPVMPVG